MIDYDVLALERIVDIYTGEILAERDQCNSPRLLDYMYQFPNIPLWLWEQLAHSVWIITVMPKECEL